MLKFSFTFDIIHVKNYITKVLKEAYMKNTAFTTGISPQ